MPDIVALRNRAAALARRRAAVREALAVLDGTVFTILPGMRMPEPEGPDEDGWDERPGLRGSVAEGARVALTSAAALYCLSGCPAPGDSEGNWRFEGGLGAIEALRRLSVDDVPDFSGEAPSLDGLNRFELSVLVGGYVAEIRRLTRDLRDAGTYAIGLEARRMPMPPAVRGRCLGLFGKPDFATDFSWTELDFAAYASEIVRVPRADPEDPRGPFESVRIDHHPRLLEARFLAPLLGDAEARAVEATLGRILAAAAPLPGEPPLETHFSSARVVDVEIPFLPEELDVEPPAAGPAPR